MPSWRDTPDARPPQEVAPFARVFRVTSRDVDEYVQLVMAADRVAAVKGGENQIVQNLDRKTYHEVVSCVELVADLTTPPAP